MPEARPERSRRRRAPVAESWLGRTVLVVSPHLDDATLSVGASIAASTSRSARVVILTVLGGNPNSRAVPDSSNHRAGFTSVGMAARVRRTEDAIACRRLGAESVWLPYDDDLSARMPNEADLLRAMRPLTDNSDLILLPGSPLSHPTHAWVTTALLRGLRPDSHKLGFYVEQPYATWSWISRGGLSTSHKFAHHRMADTIALTLDLLPIRVTHRISDYLTKLRACQAYSSQRRILHRLPLLRIGAYDLRAHGEWLWLPRHVQEWWPPSTSAEVEEAR